MNNKKLTKKTVKNYLEKGVYYRNTSVDYDSDFSERKSEKHDGLNRWLFERNGHTILFATLEEAVEYLSYRPELLD